MHIVDGVEYCHRAGTVITIPPGKAHSFKISEVPVEAICLECTFYFLKDIPSESYANVITHMFCHSFADMLKFSPRIHIKLSEESFERAKSCLMWLSGIDYRGITSAAEIKKRICEFYSLPEFALSEKDREKAKKVIYDKIAPLFDVALYLNKNYLQKINAQTLIKISNMCRASFYSNFKRLFGLTYTSYVLVLRLNRVKLLIEFSRFSAEYISDKLSFADKRYMGTLFKQRYGMTMSEFKKICVERREKQSVLKNQRFDDDFWEDLNIE